MKLHRITKLTKLNNPRYGATQNSQQVLSNEHAQKYPHENETISKTTYKSIYLLLLVPIIAQQRLNDAIKASYQGLSTEHAQKTQA